MFIFIYYQKNLILKTMIKILIPGYPEKTINYQNVLLSLGMHPVVKREYHSMESASSFDVLLLPGGGDIHPSFFHAPNLGSRNIDARMDLIQYHYLQDFVKAKKPVFGICKGMQLINVYFGGTILQDMPKDSLAIHTQTEDGEDRFHQIYPAVNTVSFPPRTINSAHHQCIEKLGDGLLVSHIATDGVIEGIYHKSLPVIGLQWHPERLPTCTETNVLL